MASTPRRILSTMATDILPVEALAEGLVSPASTLGPYRRADYERLPDEPRHELLYGRFYLSPSPLFLHQLIISYILQRLGQIARETGGSAVTAPMDVYLSDHTVVQPDILYLTRERTALVRERIEGPPDLVVEVLSPRTARRDRGEKLRAYAELGVREYWLADGMARQIEFLVNRDGRFEVALPIDGIYRSEVLPEITLDLADIWSEVEKRTPGIPENP
jgi:Uma2 family endonuclease